MNEPTTPIAARISERRVRKLYRLAVGPMHAEQCGAEEGEHARGSSQPDERQDSVEEQKREDPEEEVKAPLGDVEGERVDASSEPVVQGERGACQRPVGRAGRIVREGRGVAKEQGMLRRLRR